MGKREGSVLIQTLVLCLVLAYISVSITRWVLNRYAGSAKSYNTSVELLNTSSGPNTIFPAAVVQQNVSCGNSVIVSQTDIPNYVRTCQTSTYTNIYTFEKHVLAL